MDNIPIVLIISDGDKKPEEIITSIRSMPNDVERKEIDKEKQCYGYKYHLVTKYYETDILLCPYNLPIETYPINLLNNLEGMLIYFDAKNRDFLNNLNKYTVFLEKHQIELGILLCDELFDETKNGITYREAKEKSNLLDVIELGRKREEHEEDDPHNPIGYDELIQALKSYIWSNVQIDVCPKRNGYAKQVNHNDDDDDDDDENEDDEDTKIATNVQETINNLTNNTNLTDNHIENELESFDKIIAEVMRFRNNPTAFNNYEKLNFAESLTKYFSQLIEASDSDEDD